MPLHAVSASTLLWVAAGLLFFSLITTRRILYAPHALPRTLRQVVFIVLQEGPRTLAFVLFLMALSKLLSRS